MLDPCKSISKFKKRIFYSAKTGNLLNYVTLHVADPEVRNEYDIARCKNFDNLFKPTIAFGLLFMIYRALQVWLIGAPMIKLIYAVTMMSFTFVWAVIRCRWKKYAPLWTFFFLLM